MMIKAEPPQKRTYFPPTFISYGTMASLTKTGSGSCTGRYGQQKKKKKYWECDDD